jgi:hypothetical protein
MVEMDGTEADFDAEKLQCPVCRSLLKRDASTNDVPWVSRDGDGRNPSLMEHYVETTCQTEARSCGERIRIYFLRARAG